jgi:ABC-type sugar transport system ATPase subunit
LSAKTSIPAVSFRGISKRFPGTVALREVSFEIREGSCHALVGENGAGKSTLGKILAGIHRADEGQMEINGVAQCFRSVHEAQKAGVGIVHQELSFCPNLTVAENICLAQLPRIMGCVDWRRLHQKAQRCLDELNADLDIRQELGRLTTGQVQQVQIAAALSTGARLLVMDEPTSSLSAHETRQLGKLLENLRRRGITIVYVSHRMDEIFRFCDTVTVMRDGRHMVTKPVAATCETELVQQMIGRDCKRFFPKHLDRVLGEEELRVEGFCSPGKFEGVNFSVRAGEVLGVAGLVGAGRSEVALGIFGVDSRATGRIYVHRCEVSIHSPAKAMKLGIGLASEDRKENGLVLGMGCGDNLTLASLKRVSRYGFIRRKEEAGAIDHFFARLKVKAASPEVPAQWLSGGNQQKLVLAKWLFRECRILILDEPTRGVDVGAKAEIYQLIDELAEAGLAILMISSEMPEVLNLSTRVMVMRQGRLVRILDRAEATEERVGQLMAGTGWSGVEEMPAGSHN